MNQFLRPYSITLFFSLSMYICFPLIAGMAPNPSITQHAPAHMSVHDMFKDVPQDELLAMMEEGQQFIQYLEQHGTPEEKMAFAQAMEETLKSFTPEDWAEFEQIVETVQDKLPPLTLEPKEEVKQEPTKPQAPKETKTIPAIDNSLEKTFHNIHKAINAILLKAKSDKILTERVSMEWDNKDSFNEMVRLLQVLNKKEHITKLMTSKDEAVKTLLESIQNFNKRLQLENDQFIIADTFGLPADEETTATILKKLNKILEFFDTAIDSLLPKLKKFIEEYEPEAFKKAQEHDEDAKKALEHATKVEKQKRPHGNLNYHDKSPSSGSKRNNIPSAHYDHGGYTGHTTEHPTGYLQDIHMHNIQDAKSRIKPATESKDDKNAKKSDDKKEIKKSSYDKAIDTLDSYIESFNNADVGNYMTTINAAQKIYEPFGSVILDQTKAQTLETKRATSKQLNPEEVIFLERYNEQLKIADKNFAKNTEKALAYYDELKESIEKIYYHIDEMNSVIHAIKSSLDQMTAQELDKLYNSAALKNFGARINSYYNQFKHVQRELKNKHKLHKLERKDSSEERAYNELANKIATLHGLDRKLSDAQSHFEALHKAIKGAIGRKKREENKAASNR